MNNNDRESDMILRRIAHVLESDAVVVTSLSAGHVGQIYRLKMADGTKLVAKADNQKKPQLKLEGDMLAYLSKHSRLPVPAVVHSDERLLIMEYVEGRSEFPDGAQRHAAELLADLHNISSHAFGFEYNTLIGGLRQPNPLTDSWLDFFVEQRLLFMGWKALEEGSFPSRLLMRLEMLCNNLGHWIEEPARPSLIHGDAWSGNILAVDDRITGFLDPAIYFADPEVELAFTTLFGTFGRVFFERYAEIRPLAPGFFDGRRDIYNLYPLLVHVRLFGGGYVSSVDDTLRRYGY